MKLILVIAAFVAGLSAGTFRAVRLAGEGHELAAIGNLFFFVTVGFVIAGAIAVKGR